MARPPRVWFPGAIYHITNRGNNRDKIFLNEEDHERYLKILRKIKKYCEFKLYAYVLMDNHIHLLLETSFNYSISKIMQRINTAYSVYFNKKYERVGHVLEGRYKSIIVEKDPYLLEVSRYIHLNPVRARIVQKPEDYPWSSYRSYVDNYQLDDFSTHLADVNSALVIFGMEGAKERYKEFVEDGAKRELPLPKVSIREGQWYVGSSQFLWKAQNYHKNT